MAVTLDEVGRGSAGLHPHSEPAQLVIPGEHVAPARGIGSDRIDEALCEFRHRARSLSASPATPAFGEAIGKQRGSA